MSAVDLDALRAAHGDLGIHVSSGPTSSVVSEEVRILVPSEQAQTLLQRLRGEAELPAARLLDLTVVDRLDSTPAGFEVVYRLGSSEGVSVYRIHAFLADSQSAPPTIESVVALWPAANWLEREAFDLFGIGFSGHPDLRRIMLEADFKGAPLRKSEGGGASLSAPTPTPTPTPLQTPQAPPSSSEATS